MSFLSSLLLSYIFSSTFFFLVSSSTRHSVFLKDILEVILRSHFSILPHLTGPVQFSPLFNTQLFLDITIYTLFQPYDGMILTSMFSFMLFYSLEMFFEQARISNLSYSVIWTSQQQLSYFLL